MTSDTPTPTPADGGDDAHATARPSRRHLLAAAGVAALALGAGAAWRQHRERAAADAAVAAGPRPPARIATLDGRVLTPSDWQGRPLVLNFWAPWCPPCVKEMPELDRFWKAQGPSGALLVGLAIDDEAPVRKFLAEHPVSFPVAVIGYAGLSEVRALGNDPNVALPFTAVFARDGTLTHRKFGPTDPQELAGWTRPAA